MASSSSIKLLSKSSSRGGGRFVAVFLMLFGVVFAAAGLAALGFALPGALERGEHEGIMVSSVLGVLFTGIGLGIVWLGVHSQRSVKQRHQLEQRHPDAPWMWQSEWASREIKGSSRAVMIFLWVFGGIWNAISWPIVPGLMEEIGQGNKGALFGFLFPVVGLGLVAAAVHATLRARRFGLSTFVLDTLPGVIGGELVGTVRISKPLPFREGLRARLVCINRVTSGSGKNSSTREHVLYEEKRDIQPEEVRPGPTGSEILLQFLIPYDNRGSSDENQRSSIHWRVEMTGDFPGVDYSTHFELPVYKTEASSPDVREAVPAPESLDQALAGGGPLEGSQIQVTPIPEGGVELFFPAARNKGGARALTIFTAIWGGVTGFLATGTDAPFMMTAIFGFFEVLLGVAVLTSWFSTLRVRAGQGGLVMKGGLFGLGGEKTLAKHEVDYVEIGVSSQQGSKVFYRLRAHHGYKTTGCGSGIPDRAEVAALAALLNRALGDGPL
jgi:hypothetical protein